MEKSLPEKVKQELIKQKCVIKMGEKMKVKICGITSINEAKYLNEAGADYAGFVFYEKSKRNIKTADAKEIFEMLNSNIKKVAVMVSPDAEMADTLQKAGFDILQIHGTLSPEVLEVSQIPVWYAINITDPMLFEEKIKELHKLPERLLQKIEGIVADGAEYGSGKTFAWDDRKRWRSEFLRERTFILAGGLNSGNVQDGIRIFSPDVVDVSSGVEESTPEYRGKSKGKIKEFIRKVRSYEQ